MDMQKVIRDLFAKAASTHSPHEAESAILKAHELMAKYKISSVTTEENIEYTRESCQHTGNRSFRRLLAQAIAPNFKVRYFLSNQAVTFYGRSEDVRIAKEVFEYAYRFAHREANRHCKDLKLNHFNTDGIYNSYTFGFCKGLREKLDCQSTALMVIVPKDVEEQYANLSKDFKTTSRTLKVGGYAGSVYQKGVQDGRSILNRRSLSEKFAG